jgi:SAM-dependent methyltransferase
MFNVEFLNLIREYELARVIGHLTPGARILEIGGGTGYQARRLQEAGFEVASIDVAGCTCPGTREFPVQEYDGRYFPFPDASFDIVFSSNVLEHIPDLAQTHREMRRVLKLGGYCLHVLPTSSWRFWTNVAHYVELGQRIALLAPQLLPRLLNKAEFVRLAHRLLDLGRLIKHYLIVPRHGEFGNALTEIAIFGSRHWLRRFRAHGFDVTEAIPMGLFYTGHMVFGKRISIAVRTRLARILGSACMLYKMIPAGRQTAQRPTDAVDPKSQVHTPIGVRQIAVSLGDWIRLVETAIGE